MDISKVLPAESVCTRDFISLVVGAHLGGGAFREVFELATDCTKVIKIETGSRCFHNVAEYELWNQVVSTEYERWFAPIRYCSPCGIVLIQDRTMPVSKEELPAILPVFVQDVKAANWGRLDGRIVCHDYGFTNTGVPFTKGGKAKLRPLASYER